MYLIIVPMLCWYHIDYSVYSHVKCKLGQLYSIKKIDAEAHKEDPAIVCESNDIKASFEISLYIVYIILYMIYEKDLY